MKTRGITGNTLLRAQVLACGDTDPAQRDKLASRVFESSTERTASTVCVHGPASLSKSTAPREHEKVKSGECVDESAASKKKHAAAAKPCKSEENWRSLMEEATGSKYRLPRPESEVMSNNDREMKSSATELRPTPPSRVTHVMSSVERLPPTRGQSYGEEQQPSCQSHTMEEATESPRRLCAMSSQQQSEQKQKQRSASEKESESNSECRQSSGTSSIENETVKRGVEVVRNVKERPLPPKSAVEEKCEEHAFASASSCPKVASESRTQERNPRVPCRLKEDWEAVKKAFLQPQPPPKKSTSSTAAARPVQSIVQEREVCPVSSREQEQPSAALRHPSPPPHPVGREEPPLRHPSPSPPIGAPAVGHLSLESSEVPPVVDSILLSCAALFFSALEIQFTTLCEQLSLFEHSSFSDSEGGGLRQKRTGLCHIIIPPERGRPEADQIRCVRKFWPEWKFQQTLRNLPRGTVLELELSVLSPIPDSSPVSHSILATKGETSEPRTPAEAHTLLSASGAQLVFPCPFVRVRRCRIRYPTKPKKVEEPRTRLQRVAHAHGRLHSRVKMKVDGKRVVGTIISCSNTTCDVLYRTSSGRRKRISIDDRRVSHVWFIKVDPTTVSRDANWRPVISSGTSVQVDRAHETATGVACIERKEEDIILSTDVSHAVENTFRNEKKKNGGTRLCTFNPRTAKPRAQSRELLHFMKSRRIDVLVLPECRWTEIPFYFREYHCALNPAVNGNGGVALISKRKLIDIQAFRAGHGCISGRIDCGKFHLRVFANYCPHSSHPRPELVDFWNGFNQFCSDVQKRDYDTGTPTRRVTLGDMNAGDRSVKQKHHLTADLRAEHMQLNDLRSCFDMLPRKERKVAYTWVSPNGKYLRQLDGVLLQQRYFSDLSNVQILDPPIPADHNPIVVDLKFHCRSKKQRPHKDPPPDFTRLRDPEVKAKCLEVLQPVLNNPESTYSELAECIREATTQHLVVLDAAATDFTAPNDPVVEQVRKTGDLRSLMKASAVADIQYCTQVIDKFEVLLKTQPKKAYEQLTNLTSPATKSWPTKSSASDIINHVKSINGLPREHTHPGFAIRQNMFDDVRVSEADFSLDEVRKGIHGLQPHKATGEDAVAAEFFTLPELLPTIHRLVNEYLSGKTIDECLITLIALVPKKGDLSVVQNYRPVCLLSHFLKLINLLLLIRIRASVDPFLRYGQNGFRQYRGTMSHAMALQMLIATGEPLFLLFVDFSSAFPSITFESIVSALRAFRIPERIIDAVMRCHHGHQVRVKGEDGEIIDGSFELRTGVMQGDTLAPYLFIMVLDCLLCELTTITPLQLSGDLAPRSRYALRSGQMPSATKLAELGYADDLLFPFTSIDSIKPLLEELQTKAKSIGLDLNLKKGKTEYVIVNVAEDTEFPPVIIDDVVSGSPVTINRASDYTYLGTHVVNLEAQVNRRIGLAWTSVKRFRAFWDSKCPFGVKKQLFTCLVQSALTYGMELLTPALASKLDAAYGRLLTYVFARGQTQDEWEQYHNGEFPHLSSLLIFRRIKLVGHALRRDEPLSRILKTNHIMCFKACAASDLRKPDGRQPSIIKSLSQDLSHYSLAGSKYSVKDAQPFAKWPDPWNRDAWRKLANECAAQHEDALYAPILEDRVKRWEAPCHDINSLDGRIVNKHKLKSDIAALQQGRESEIELFPSECRNPSHGRLRRKCKKCFDEYVGMTYVKLRVNRFQETLERNYRHDDAVTPSAPRPSAHSHKANYVRFRDLEYEKM